ncbi:hypothetical protein VNI00_015950 [Paramarasmius palmivorus]|uniref:Uncharacterized protein n=1 Tax=Paramarasmius palmivorus TaxID=297713 RepID=A0AAW0BGX5_9AGAR
MKPRQHEDKDNSLGDQETGEKLAHVPGNSADVHDLNYEYSDDEPDVENALGGREVSRGTGDKLSTAVPPGPPQSTIVGPSSAIDGNDLVYPEVDNARQR